MMKTVQMVREHIAQVAELEKICFSLPWSEKSLAEELINPDAVFLCREIDGKVAGYVGSIISDGCYVTNVAVFPQFRRMGCARLLLTSLEEKAKERNCEFITLEVRKSNLPAIGLYSSLGYSVAGERKNFYESPVENALIMTKNF